MLALRDRVVVLTGAGSGIGAALAVELAGQGARLALIDRDAEGLDATAEAARGKGATVAAYAMDVTDRDAAAALPAKVLGDLGAAAVLINNAGIALGGGFEHVSDEQFDRVMAVNFRAPVALTRAFLPQLRASRPAQIVNVSSVFGLIGVPGNVAYCSAKFGLRGFSEALRTELAAGDVGVSVVHPGGVRTRIATSSERGVRLDPALYEAGQARAKKLLTLAPEVAAARILKGLLRREKRIVVGKDALFLAFLTRLFPVAYGRFMPKS